MKTTYNILIGGPAGSGIESSGMLLGKALMRAGASVFVCNEIMSQIRGGHNFNRVRFSFTEAVTCHDDLVDVVVPLDKLSATEHLKELHEGGVVIGEDLDKALSEIGVGALYKNTLALGIIYGLFGLELKWISALLKETFGGKGAEVVDGNLKALEKGVEIGKRMGKFEVDVGDGKVKRKMLLNGNDAICLGAVASGCKFVSEYPMTPSSSILHTMAKWADKKGIVVKHAEDEIAAMNMIVGGGFAGARSLTGTSGGGFALMTEAVGLAGASETPCVVVEAQRAGPSTGFPTRTEQGDLRQVLHASQGDFPRLVMAPGDMKESFERGFAAFNYADVFQIPVVIMMDKFISESVASVEPFDIKGLKIERGKILREKDAEKISAEGGGFFKRYALSDDGVSARTLPGTSHGMHVATSYEHNEYSELLEDVVTRVSQMDKRMQKMNELKKILPKPELIDGDGNVTTNDADVTFVAFGSTKMVLSCAVRSLLKQGVKANILMIKYLTPFHDEEVLKILKNAKRPVLVEQNFSGMLGGLITEKTGFIFKEKFLKYDGREMDGKWIVDKLLKTL